MPQPKPVLPILRMLSAAAVLSGLSACASAPAGNMPAAGQRITLQGEIVSVDTAPWAYDGNAVLVVATASTGNIRVQLPARWNLCKAPPPDNVQSLQPRDRVEVTGTKGDQDEVIVCGDARDRLHKL